MKLIVTFCLSLLHAKISSLSYSRKAPLCIFHIKLLSFADLDKCNFHIYCFLFDSRLSAFERKEHRHNLCRNLIVVLQNGTTEEVTSEEEEEEDMGEVCVDARLLS